MPLQRPGATGNDEKFLFHYTGIGTAEKITSSKELWATNIYYLNDGSEFKHGAQVMREYLVAAAGRGRKAGAFREAAEWAALDAPNVAVFVVSFSESSDLLSQWRSYCPPNRGISLGFEFDKLQQSAGVQKFELLRCSYRLREHRSMMKKVADTAIKHFADAGTDAERADVVRDFSERFARATASCKDPSFQEEREWRLVAIRDTAYSDVRYREGISTLTPYLTFKLPVDDKNRLRLRRVILGPTPHPKLAGRAVTNMMKHRNVLWGTVDDSKTPFRAW